MREKVASPRAQLKKINNLLVRLGLDKAKAQGQRTDQSRCILLVDRPCNCELCVIDRRYRDIEIKLGNAQRAALQLLAQQALGADLQLEQHRYVAKITHSEVAIRYVLKLNLTDKERAVRLGVSRRTITNWKRRYSPTKNIAQR